MNKTIKTIVMAALCLNLSAYAQKPTKPKKHKIVKTTDTIKVSPAKASIIEPEQNLKEVNIVSTGYQTLPKERATGSFTQLSNKDLNRRVSTDILSRIEDIVPGLSFSKNNSNFNFYSSQSQLSIRGQSTIMGNANPLIVIDNFPYDGDLNNINPNDVESITVLKDAASASIWGAKAANGVIVITTKKGHSNQAPKISFNTNFTVGNKPDLFYQPQMSSADFIDVEKSLFKKGYYSDTENSSTHASLTPVVELLIAKRDGLLAPATADAQIEALKNYDTRKDLEKYFLQKSFSQQYAISLTGGNQQQNYYLSAGLDKNMGSIKPASYNRITINANQSTKLLKDKLEFTTQFNFIQSNTNNAPALYNASYNNVTTDIYYPYARLADDQGNALTVIRDFRPAFKNSATDNGLLDWNYKPLDELNYANDNIKLNQFRVNASLSYKILPQLTASGLFLYDHADTRERNNQSMQSYFTRNLINSYTQIISDNSLAYPIPLGSIMDLKNNTTNNISFRGQLNYNQILKEKHQITAIAGYEIRQQQSLSNTNRNYGYDEEHALTNPVSYLSSFPQYFFNGYTAAIPYVDTEKEWTDRYLSYFTNAAYTYNNCYLFSASARLDQSNLFGVKANQKGTPLYSLGLGWIINQESFYHADWLPYLKLRLTYGANGNVYKNLSALTNATAQNYYYNYPNTGLPFASITNPPNPTLKWERVKVWNAGLDFSSKNARISGTLEFYQKKGTDLIGTSVIDPTSGITTFTGNNAATMGKGIDLNLNSLNTNGQLKWATAFIGSYSKTIVTRYNLDSPPYTYLSAFGQPLAGKPLLSIFSNKTAGLDPQTGDPRGYLNGQISKDYYGILTSQTINDLVYNGSATPSFFGSLRNTISFKNISLSANIAYRLGYYFRKNTVNFGAVAQGIGSHGDYSLRWQKPGDELSTIVPSMPATPNYLRQNFYTYSDVLVDKADHIRLQDINLAYTLPKNIVSKLNCTGIQFYLYANNLGLIWKANHFNLDPDYQLSGPPPRTLSLGCKIDL
nr:SusC/RagA family TonB-linked outer membrane protein [Pedobacter sp. ASV19]